MKSESFILELQKLKERLGKEKQALLNSRCMSMPMRYHYELEAKINAEKAYKKFQKARKEYDLYWSNVQKGNERLIEISSAITDIETELYEYEQAQKRHKEQEESHESSKV